MAHYAKVDAGKVIKVIVAEADFFDNFVDDTPGEWIQTSYNTKGGVHYDPITGLQSEDQTKALRKNFASVGFDYDADKDAFIPPQVAPSWTLNETTCLWESPIPFPDDGNDYWWDEDAYQADTSDPKTAGWTLRE